MTEMISKIKAYSSKNKSYVPKNSTEVIFIYAVELEDGTTGDSGSKKKEGNFNVGDKVSYTVKENPKGTWISLKKIDENGNLKSDFNDPVSLHKTAYARACFYAQMVYERVKAEPENVESLKAFADFFYEWLVNGLKTRNDLFDRRDILETAIKCAGWDHLQVQGNSDRISDRIILIASELYSNLKQIDHDKVAVQPPVEGK